jgi:CheY-like chemotaxis protein
MASVDASYHIMIVEDDLSTAEMLSAYFRSLGYQVSHVGWGYDAVKVAVDLEPDLVVLDIHLPDIDGYEVCKRLRSHRHTRDTPIIFLTQRRERSDRLVGLDLGAIDYITKPFDVQELRFRVRNVLRKQESEAYLHPVTELPTSKVLEEQLEEAFLDSGLGLIGVSLEGMPAFSDAYGFVAHDDVLRAFALILRNTTEDTVGTGCFVGQVDLYQYVIIAPVGEQRDALIAQLDQRLHESLSFFYPHREWEQGHRSDGSELPRIEFEVAAISNETIPSADANSLIWLREVLSTP